MALTGADIILWGGDTAETVHDVLIGEPLNGGREFTLGIPKGDIHDWLDRRVSFFGRDFCTTGFPEEGIEANIPLRWHKRVHVRMTGTQTVTVWEHESLARHTLGFCEVWDMRGITAVKDILLTADRLGVRVPSCSADYVPKAGDLIAASETDFELAADDPQEQSAKMAEFRRTVTGYAVIEAVTVELNGRRYNYTITAK